MIKQGKPQYPLKPKIKGEIMDSVHSEFNLPTSLFKRRSLEELHICYDQTKRNLFDRKSSITQIANFKARLKVIVKFFKTFKTLNRCEKKELLAIYLSEIEQSILSWTVFVKWLLFNQSF